ncbi:hypothetical protein F4806DRAFT_488633 [Annulohypoxylon nitens]|nr:hypothetical protein F4806DRAFT_488633 [Annulohypoxylon nitens]
MDTSDEFVEPIPLGETIDENIPNRLPANTISEDFSCSDSVNKRKFLALQSRTSNTEIPLSVPPKPTVPYTELPQRGFGVRNTLFPKDKKLPIIDVGKRSRLEFQSESNPTEFDTNILSLDIPELQDYITRFQKRAKELEESSSKSEHGPKFLVLYRISQDGELRDDSTNGDYELRYSDVLYLDEPQWLDFASGRGVLQARAPVKNFDLFLEQNKDTSFIAYKTYTVAKCTSETSPKFTVGESIEPIHEDLIKAINQVLESKEEYTGINQVFKRTRELQPPYLFVFHQRNEWDSIQSSLPERCRQYMTTLWDYIIQQYSHEYAGAHACISSGMITSRYVDYLFRPGETVVQRTGNQYIGWVAKSWARFVRLSEKKQRNDDPVNPHWKANVIPTYNPKNTLEKMHNREVIMQEWEIDAWNWVFDGKFQRRQGVLKFYVRDSAVASEITSAATESTSGIASGEDFTPITELEVFPVLHAPKELFDRLQQRGKTFWRCRIRGFVSYQEDANNSKNNLICMGIFWANERYMIDVKTYRTLHSESQYRVTEFGERIIDQLEEEAMSKDKPPEDCFELLLPPTIKGFQLRTKKWHDLNVDQVEDVTWNVGVFEKVQLEDDSKDLIRALVSNTIASEQNTDLIQGKGNGLILLLHGSPGTGKTLTAESVAEMTKKPLYRVTCGDIGTKAEEVEKYLESVFYLGRLWDCVVLLDEADIFLEKRSTEDMERNALVSVFLRVLEYYEGILILTSNRVKIFDEAFKSRIQLALYYPELGPSERRHIWKNFLDRLSEVDGDSIDLKDLECNLEDLKDVKMNGREIRNAITTARQSAKYQNERLNYRILKKTIEVSRRFDKYFRNENEDESVEDGRAMNDWMR